MLKRLKIENFKSWQDTGDIPLKPITGFFGPNSSGKSSLFHALLLMKQTSDSSDRGILFNFGDDRTPVDLDNFQSVIHKHDTKRVLGFSIDWQSKDQITIPQEYYNGAVSVGDDLQFEIRTSEQEVGSGRMPILEKTSYRVANTRFAVQRVDDEMTYDFIVTGPDGFLSRRGLREFPYFRRTKFYTHLYWCAERKSKEEQFFFDLQYDFERLLDDMYYLGPLRSYPNRIYSRSGAQPRDMGRTGEFVVDAMLSSLERHETMSRGGQRRSVTIDKYVAGWLKHLGLIHSFRIASLARGRRLFEVKVQKSRDSAEVLLTDVGFGVSQILPVLALCFYVPEGSTVLLEQPDIQTSPASICPGGPS